MFKIAVAVILLAHGIGHSMGLLQILKVATISPVLASAIWIHWLPGEPAV